RKIIRARRLEIRRVARFADVHHRGHLELAHLFVQRVPVPIRQRRSVEEPAARVGIQIAADETKLVDATFELAYRRVDRRARRLRQLRDADEILRVELREPVDQIVAVLGPRFARRRVAEVMTHPARARAEDRDVRAALALQLELRALHARAQLIVADRERALLRLMLRIRLELGFLPVAIVAELLRRRRVVAVAVDDHGVPDLNNSVATKFATASICSGANAPPNGGMLPRPSRTVVAMRPRSVMPSSGAPPPCPPRPSSPWHGTQFVRNTSLPSTAAAAAAAGAR